MKVYAPLSWMTISVQKLSKDSFNNVVLTGLKACGYIDQTGNRADVRKFL